MKHSIFFHKLNVKLSFFSENFYDHEIFNFLVLMKLKDFTKGATKIKEIVIRNVCEWFILKVEQRIALLHLIFLI